MVLLITPLLQQTAHHLGALDALGLAVAIEDSHFSGRNLKADFSRSVSSHQSLSRIKRPAAPRGSRQTPAIREREGKHGACRGENGGNPSRHTMEVHTTIAKRDSHENLSEVRHVDQLREDSRTTWHGPGSPIFSVHRVHLPSLLTCAIGANASPGSANRHAGWRGRSTKVPAITGFALGLFISGLDQLGLGYEPIRPNDAKLPNAAIWKVFPPLRNGAGGDFEQVGKGFRVPCEFDCMLGFHVREFSTLNTTLQVHLTL